MTILVPLNGSSRAERALPYAGALAKRLDGKLMLVLTNSDPTAHDDVVPDGQSYLSGIVDRMRRSDIDVESGIAYGDLHEVIPATIDRHQVDLLVMTDSADGGLSRWSSGSSAEQMLRRLDVPMLLIPEDSEQSWLDGARDRLLVALDGSTFAEEALIPASDLGRPLGTSLLLMQVVEPINPALYGDPEACFYLTHGSEAVQREAQEYLDGVARRLQDMGTRAEVLAGFGRPATQISAAAAQPDIAAIVMATHGRSGLARLVLESVASGVIQQATRPVLLIRPGATKGRTGAEPRTTSELVATAAPS